MISRIMNTKGSIMFRPVLARRVSPESVTSCVAAALTVVRASTSERSTPGLGVAGLEHGVA
ncbi:MAG: hypothetical protein HND58_16050 [Planctomycetota bacterium]|nr:MAG: hypothetical protein HND58_16050 [Planctomycetota bacterium]